MIAAGGGLALPPWVESVAAVPEIAAMLTNRECIPSDCAIAFAVEAKHRGHAPTRGIMQRVAIQAGAGPGAAPWIAEEAVRIAAWTEDPALPSDESRNGSIGREPGDRDQMPATGALLGTSFAALLNSEPKPPEWQIDQICERGDVLVLGSPPAFGKTYLAMELSFCVAVGRPVWGRFGVISPGRVAYLDLEMGMNRMCRRAQRIASGLGIDGADLEGRAWLWTGGLNFKLDDDALRSRLLDQLLLYKGAGELDLIVIDTARRAMAGDEQDSGDVAKWFGFLKELQAASGGPTILILHHTRKGIGRKDEGGDPGDWLRGSGDWRAAADHVFLVASKTGGRFRILNPKSRERELPPFHLVFSGWAAEKSDPDDWSSPLRLTYEADDVASRTPRRPVQTFVVEFLEGQSDRRALRQDIDHALAGKAKPRTINDALSELAAGGVAEKIGTRGRTVTWALK